MQIILNGDAKEIAQPVTVQGLLDELRIPAGRVACEVNLKIIKRAFYGDTVLREGDTVEIYSSYRRRVKLLSGVIIFLGLIAFAPTLHIPFQLDDHTYIESNHSIRQWNYASIRNDFLPEHHESSEMYYRPLQTLVNRFHYTLWKLNPFGYHLTNLLLHLANAILMAMLLLRLSFPVWSVGITGALFVVHPAIVSEMIMVSGIPEIMSLFFSLITLLLLLRKEWTFVVLGLCSYLLGLLSKESALAVPFYFAFMQFYMSSKDRRIRTWIGLGIVTLLYVVLRAAGLGNLGADGSLRELFTFTLWRFPNVLLRYVGLILAPWNLHQYRLMPSIPAFWGYGLLVLLATAYIRFERPRWLLFCGGWFLSSLIPKIPLMANGHYMLEHWIYPGVPALLLPIGLGLNRLVKSTNAIHQRVAVVLFTVLLGFYVFSARFHIAVRNTEEKSYRWSLQFTQASPLLFNLGLICLSTGRAQEAVTHIQPVYDLYPNDPNIARAMAAATRAAGQSR